MTVSVAEQILQKPVFGNETHIEALGLLRLRSQVVEAEAWGMQYIGSEDGKRNLNRMGRNGLLGELEAWQEAGYQQ
jgi:hypothetical protein